MHVQVMARRWNDTYGNTYHSVSVVKDGEHVGTVPFEYGYGDHYLHTAGKVLGLPDPYVMGQPTARKAAGIELVTDVVDVSRRRDLHNGGRA